MSFPAREGAASCFQKYTLVHLSVQKDSRQGQQICQADLPAFNKGGATPAHYVVHVDLTHTGFSQVWLTDFDVVLVANVAFSIHAKHYTSSGNCLYWNGTTGCLV